MMPLDIGYTQQNTPHKSTQYMLTSLALTMSTKQLLINTNEDSDLPYKGELRARKAAKQPRVCSRGSPQQRPTLVNLPAEGPPIQQEPYDRPTIAIDWTRLMYGRTLFCS